MFGKTKTGVLYMYCTTNDAINTEAHILHRSKLCLCLQPY